MKKEHRYERYVDGKIEVAPISDIEGEITGHHICGLRAWLDENPEERIALGYIKHYTVVDPDFDRQTEYITTKTNVIDDYTMEDQIIVHKKSEEMMAQEELNEIEFTGRFGNIVFF